MLGPILNTRPGRVHFVGIAGSGMYPLARFLALKSNKRITGSDRAFDRDQNPEIRRMLEAAGIEVFPQDGRSLDAKTSLVVISRAVEEGVPEMVAVQRHSIPVITRAELMAHIANSMQSIAIAGTSGKTTVTGMCAHIFRQAGMKPNVICGGLIKHLVELDQNDSIIVDDSELLIFEADESDGTLVNYKPMIGAILNIAKDHKPVPELIEIFRIFANSCQQALVYNRGDARVAESLHNLSGTVPRYSFGWNDAADIYPQEHKPFGWGSIVKINNMGLMLKVPGEHNIENALAVTAIGLSVGLPLSIIAEGLADFRGIRRRLDRIGTTDNGITVIDDFAHNPEKIRASLKTLQATCSRLIIIYQPHGFTPTLFLKDGLIEIFTSQLRGQDILVCLEIYYGGGTVERTISSQDLVMEITRSGRQAYYIPERSLVLEWLKEHCLSSDTITVMGARDDTLTDFARAIFNSLGPVS